MKLKLFFETMKITAVEKGMYKKIIPLIRALSKWIWILSNQRKKSKTFFFSTQIHHKIS